MSSLSHGRAVDGALSNAIRHPRVVAASAVAIGGGAVAAFVALSTSVTGDYITQAAVAGDNPAPAISALLHGQLSRLAAEQPLMGLTSILWRAPFVGFTNLFGHSDLLAYRIGALVCLLPTVFLLARLVAARRHPAHEALNACIAGVLVLAGPATLAALRSGHPEEVLASVLATAAVTAAILGRSGWAAVLLGLAIGTKQWALIAAVPVLAALQRERLRIMLLASLVGAATAIPLALADPRGVRERGPRRRGYALRQRRQRLVAIQSSRSHRRRTPPAA